MTPHQRLWLALTPCLLATLDVAMTFAGQPAAYWDGEFASAQEFNPLGYWFLTWHPLAFLIAAILWVAAFAACIALLPRPAAFAIAFLISFDHAVGGATWIWRLGPWGIAATVAYLTLAERLLSWTWRKAGWRDSGVRNTSPPISVSTGDAPK